MACWNIVCQDYFCILTTFDFVIGNQVLGLCEIFEERQVGNERFNIFTGCPGGETATIVLRGGADQVSFIFYYNPL
jgi:chaperonin GroEL (HSP60 family)